MDKITKEIKLLLSSYKDMKGFCNYSYNPGLSCDDPIDAMDSLFFTLYEEIDERTSSKEETMKFFVEILNEFRGLREELSKVEERPNLLYKNEEIMDDIEAAIGRVINLQERGRISSFSGKILQKIQEFRYKQKDQKKRTVAFKELCPIGYQIEHITDSYLDNPCIGKDGADEAIKEIKKIIAEKIENSSIDVLQECAEYLKD